MWGVLGVIEKWHKEAKEYKYNKNNSNEYCCIVNVIKEVWAEYCSELLKQRLSDEDNLHFEVIDNEIKSY